jgi:hypothetical protein
MAIGMQLGGPPPVDPPLVIPPLVTPPVLHMFAFCCPGGAHRSSVWSQTMFVPWYLQQPAPCGSQRPQMVGVQPASPPPPVVPPPLVLPPVPVTPPVDPPDIEAPVDCPPVLLADPVVDELVPLPLLLDPAVVELPPVAVVEPVFVQAALLAYSQTPLAPHTPFGQSLPESQAKSTQAGGSVGHPASKNATMTRGSDFTM